MYLDYFSLERHPFRITPDTSLFFSGGEEGRGVVLDAMLYAIETGEGIIKVVGEVGSGKTMLCRMLEERLPDTTEVVYIANPNLSPEEILYAIAFELKLPIRRDTTKLLVMQQLQNYLLKQYSANRKVLVIIEEAQGMPVETLEEVRLFSNLETHRDKLMQMILFGQPELDQNLSQKKIRQLRERITHSFYLNPLHTSETSEYISFRLGAAGCPCPGLFTPNANWLISKASGGLTRRINILADKALLAAFAGSVLEGIDELTAATPPLITWKHVWAAIRDSDYITSVFYSMLTPLRIMGASMAVVLVAITFLLWPRATGFAEQSKPEMTQAVYGFQTEFDSRSALE
ncbi:MAG: AAA family ATPase [Gammaproteobacteria bacterium]